MSNLFRKTTYIPMMFSGRFFTKYLEKYILNYAKYLCGIDIYFYLEAFLITLSQFYFHNRRSLCAA